MLLALAGTVACLAVIAPPALAGRGDVIVRFSQGADAGDRSEARADAGTDFERSLRLRGAQLVDPEPGVSTTEAVKKLEAAPDVLYAEPDRPRTAVVVPNDPGFNRLWGLNNTGQSVLGYSGTADADIDAPETWDITTGNAAVTVGVVDTGIDATHPDLSPNMLSGWDFVDGDSDPNDLNGHGTHVAGTIGARGNDGVGVAGVSWHVGLMPVRVLDANGSGWVSDVADGYTYAAQHGASVVNASLGSSSSSTTERDAIAAASDTLFVVAAGNGGSDGVGDDNDTVPDYPCDYNLANIVCVAASDMNDGLTSFSNYGASTVDLAAPGELIRSTWPGAISPCSGSPCWAYLDGTSMATPHVSGAAALVRAEHPDYTVSQLKQALLGSVDPKPALAGKTVTGGRLNVFAAVTGAPPPVEGTAPPPGGSVPAPAAPRRAPTAPASDRTPPTIGVSVRRQRLRTVLRRGLRVVVKSSEAATLRVDLVVGRGSTAARRVGASGTVVLGRARDSLAGSGSVTRPVKLSARARRALRGLRGVRLRVRVRAEDRKGNARTVSRPVVLR